MGPSASSRALDALLDAGGPEAEAIKASSIHRTALWRYRNGKAKPDAEGVALLERISAGRVPANGWEDEAAPLAEPEAEQAPTGTGGRS